LLGVDESPVFKALADPTRRFLLDLLLEREGRTLSELEAEVDMTRIGVMKHLRLLEAAGLVITRRAGRAKLHFLNPVPIRLIHNRWIGKYTERQASALADLKNDLEAAMTETQKTRTVQMYQVYIRATPEAIWEAITQPEWTVRYGFAPVVNYDLRPGGGFRAYANEGMKALGCPHVISDGEVLHADPPRRLVQTWRMTMTPDMAAEAFTRLTYEIKPARGGVTKLTVTHDVTGAPMWAAVLRGESESRGAGGGWNEILSGLKTLLETGQQLPFQSGPG
jgi:uncharacterized protein YndB with AHSA1/START domain